MLIFAFLFTTILLPLVDQLESKIKSRGISIVIVTISLITTFVVFLKSFASGMVSQAREFSKQIGTKGYDDNLNSLATNLESYLNKYINIPDIDSSNFVSKLNVMVGEIIQNLMSLASAIGGFIFTTIMVLIFTIILLSNYYEFKKSIVQFIPNKYFEMGLRVIFNIERQVSKYLQGQLLAASSVALMSFIGLSILNLMGANLTLVVFIAIIAEGISALNTDNGWAGSLTGFQGGAGYWVIVQEDLSFSYNTEDLLARSVHSFSEKLPDEAGFTVAQSSRQAFYYVDDIKLDNGGVEDGDWILSYNNDVLAGIRQWKGNTVDIPNMGSAGDMVTAGYFNEGDVPTFKLLKQSTGKIITLEGNIPSWSDNGIFILGELYEKQPIPELFVLNKAYPNPFNPTTTIGFGLPDQSEIIIEIYNLYGKRVETLVDKSMPAGYSSLVWNADKFSSGLYFVKLSAHSLKGIKYTSIQKLMLVK